jgi:O-antigen/teichoic acid export membrane protein
MHIAKRALYNTIYNYAGILLTMVFSVLATRYVLRALYIEDFGLYNLLLVPVAIFAQLFAFGVPSSMLRFIPELKSYGDVRTAQKLLALSLKVVLGAGAVFFILSLFFRGWYAGLIGRHQMYFALPVLILLGVLKVVTDILSSVLDAQLQHGVRNFCDILVAGLKLLSFMAVLKLQWGVWGLIAASGALDLFLLIIYSVRLWTITGAEEVSAANRAAEGTLISRYWKFSLKEYLYKSFSFFWSAWIDIYFIEHFAGSFAAGIFSFALTISFYLFNWNPGIAMQTIIRPLFARQFVKNNSVKEQVFMFDMYNKFCLFFALPSFVFFAILADKVIMYIFDPKYVQSLYVLYGLLPFVFLQILLHPIRNILSSIERNEITAYSNVVIFYKIALSYFLVKAFHINGAIFAFGSSVILIFAIQYYLTRRIIPLQYPWGSCCRVFLNTAVASAVIWIFRPAVCGVLSLFAMGCTGILVYILMSLRNRVFSTDERRIFNKAFPVPLWQF